MSSQTQFFKKLMTAHKITGPSDLSRQLKISVGYSSRLISGERKINDAIKFKLVTSFPSCGKDLISIKTK